MDLFNTGIRPAVDDYLLKLAQEKRDYGDYWSASSAGYCQRKVIFDRLGVPPVKEDARKQRVFESGHIFHEWIQRITKDTGLSIAQELELIDEDLMIKGHFDDLVLIDGKLILYDYKTQNSRAFTYMKDRPMSRYHKYQLGTYMYMLRKLAIDEENYFEGWHDKNLSEMLIDKKIPLTEARILKISKDDLRMSEEQLLWTAELQAEVVNYWARLNKYWAAKKLPPCTCADHEGGFMAKENYNPYYFQDEPCSLKYYKLCKEKGLLK